MNFQNELTLTLATRNNYSHYNESAQFMYSEEKYPTKANSHLYVKIPFPCCLFCITQESWI